MSKVRACVLRAEQIHSVVHGLQSETVCEQGTARMKYDYIFVVSNDDEAGKSTFANVLGEELGLIVGETGHCIDIPLANVLTACHGGSFAELVANMAQDKAGWRVPKKVFGDEMCRVDAECMVKWCINQGARIVVGCRRPEEIATWIQQQRMCLGATRAKLFILYRPKSGEEVKAAVGFLGLQIDTEEILNDGDVEALKAVAKLEAAKMR